ncbi:hypothetical protein Poli38472_005792 [Pythium oligandrum]|uniref:Uncharacterized protein n=1 Tax=Pythium oligandrum TaxID=41045 RepID=A0A8K1FPF4_PYTOL|nr:hypothetical protein Poli38472_005792 [Pythium oligandrum]|eukprot:TMW68324.1 hypothetical protein Poli38472_005792 [Pythium oligandrum]
MTMGYERLEMTAATLVPTEDKHACAREHWRRALQDILREHEPTRVAYADDLLDAYEGMEHELVQCYRHYYTGEGGFRIATDSTSDAPFALPREAIDTYLRLRLRSRRSQSFAAKGDDVREPEAPSALRQRAASAMM